MAQFSASDAAMEGFRIARRKPMAMLAWAGASLVISLVSAALMVTLFGESLNQMMQMDQASESSPDEAIALMGQMGLFYLVLFPIVILIFAIFTAAVYRAVLKPQDDKFAYLRLGADELRLAVVQVVLFLLMILATFALAMVIGLVAAAIGIAAGGGDAGVGAAVAIGFAVAVLYIGMLVAMLAIWTKFSFAGPMTFVDRKIRIFESWRATKGFFWPLLGSYLLAVVLGIVVSMLGGVIGLAFVAALGGLDANAGWMAMIEGGQMDFTSLGAFFTPANIANMVVSSLFSALTYAIFLAPPAVAYRDIRLGAADVSRTFE